MTHPRPRDHAERPPERFKLATFLRENRERILREWEQATRRLPAAAELEPVALRDHMPGLLDHLCEVVEGHDAALADLPAVHASQRIRQGLSLELVAREYALLRETVHRLLEAERATVGVGVERVFNAALDEAVVQAVTRYHRARTRTLETLEELSREALTSREDLRGLLRSFLGLVESAIGSVDTAAVYLRDESGLVLRAAVGVEAGLEDRFALRVGEGFAGAIAARKQPMFTRSATREKLVRNEALLFAGVQALYGVPLLDGQELVGVAKMGSRDESAFTEDERQLFRSMAARAAGLIARRQVAEERELTLGMLGHDLRSPLNAIILGADYLTRHEELSQPAVRTTRQILAAGRRMNRMIGDLSDYTRLRFGVGLEIEPHVGDLREVVDEISGELRRQGQVDVDLAGDLVGDWDRDRLARVISNLVNNAIAHGSSSGRVDVRVDGTDAQSVTIRVHNEGKAISPALMPHLFEPFRRGDDGTTGMGLGLHIVKRVVAAHGGTIDVASTEQDGTTFTVRLPRWYADESPPAPGG